MKAFLIGVAAGVAGSVILLVAAVVAMDGWAQSQPRPAVGLKTLTVEGAAVSRNGAAAVELLGHGELRITCRDTCDDLTEEDRASIPLGVRVLDRSGDCLLCRDRFTEAEKKLDRWTLDGRAGLELTGKAGDGA